MSSTGHVIGNRFTYFLVFVALMVGTAITVAVTYVHLGWLNLPLALAIAVTKAMLVIMFFMHLKDHPKLIKVTFGAAFFFFLILIAHTLSDYLSRGPDGHADLSRRAAWSRSRSAAQPALSERTAESERTRPFLFASTCRAPSAITTGPPSSCLAEERR